MNDKTPSAMLENSTVAATPKPSAGGMMAGASAMVQRTLAEVQVAVMMAKQFPRNKIEAQEKLVNDCCRLNLAAAGLYSYNKGGTEITGPSIRLAEAAKTAWGNMQSGWREVSRSVVDGVGISEVEAFAWDCENNTRASRTFTVKHWRDTKKGGYPIKDERDIYELCANQAARRERACILTTIDGDIIEAAVDQCLLTLNTKGEVTPEKIAGMVKVFAEYGVTKGQIEKRIQCRIDAINAPRMIALIKVYNSIKDGMSKPEEWFDKEDEPEGEAAGATTATQKAKDALKKTTGKGLHKGEDPGIAEEYIDPKTGEVTEKKPEPKADDKKPDNKPVVEGMLFGRNGDKK